MSQNVALNKPATSSSYIKPFTPSRAVDGNTTPIYRWLANVPNWLCVDLGKPTWIRRWVLSQMGNIGWRVPDYNLSTYKLQGSNDNVNWIDLDTVSAPLSVCDRTIAYSCYRYFRVAISRGLAINPQLVGIAEFQLYDCNLLTNILLSQGTLAPSFVGNSFNYTASVAYDISAITVTPVAASSSVGITVNGMPVVSGTASAPLALNEGNNSITVQVADVIPITYTISVTRASNPNANYLSNLTLSQGTLTPTFVKDTYSYTSSVGYDVSSITVTPTAYVAGNTIKVNGTVVASGTASSAMPLNVGDNSITVQVFKADGTLLSTYTVMVTRASNPYLQQLVIGGFSPAVTITIQPNVWNYNVNVPSSTANIRIKPTAQDANATIKINDVVVANNGTSAAIPVTAGTIIKINVTSQIGGQQANYQITVVK